MTVAGSASGKRPFALHPSVRYRVAILTIITKGFCSRLCIEREVRKTLSHERTGTLLGGSLREALKNPASRLVAWQLES